MACWRKEMTNIVVCFEMELCKAAAALKMPKAPRAKKTAPGPAPKTPTPTTPAPSRLFQGGQPAQEEEPRVQTAAPPGSAPRKTAATRKTAMPRKTAVPRKTAMPRKTATPRKTAAPGPAPTTPARRRLFQGPQLAEEEPEAAPPGAAPAQEEEEPRPRLRVRPKKTARALGE